MTHYTRLHVVRWLLALLLLLSACRPRTGTAPPAQPSREELPSSRTGAWRVVRFSCNLPLHHEAGMLAAVMVWGIVRVEIDGDRFKETLAGRAESVGKLTPRGQGFRIDWPRAPRGFFDGGVAEPDGTGGWIVAQRGCVSHLRRPGEAEALPKICVSRDSHTLERRTTCRSGEQEARPKDWSLRRVP